MAKRKRVRKAPIRRRRRSTRGLGGAMRTCIEYACVKVKPGMATSPGSCKKGWALRCKRYTPRPGLAPQAGQRKGYAQYIYGRSLPSSPRTARGLFPPGKTYPGSLRPIEDRVRVAVPSRRIPR